MQPHRGNENKKKMGPPAKKGAHARACIAVGYRWPSPSLQLRAALTVHVAGTAELAAQFVHSWSPCRGVYVPGNTTIFGGKSEFSIKSAHYHGKHSFSRF